MRLGILGGTFDPPHNGHLLIAQATRRALELARVIFMPAHQPPHKMDEHVSPLADRLAMLRLAVDDLPQFEISLLEVERQGPSYTVDTLRELRRDLGERAELYFIMGMDSLANFATWHQPAEIVKLAKLAVLSRPGYAADLDALEARVPGVKNSVVFVDAPETDVSASEIRARAAAGESIRSLVPPAVADYIERHQLYSI